VPGGYGDKADLSVPIRTPPGDVAVRACLRNAGHRAVRLFASRDRTRSRSPAFVDGRPTHASVWFALYERRPVTLLGRLPDTLRRMSAFRASFVGPWLLWPLALLFFFGVPAGIAAAVWLALRDEVTTRSHAAAASERTPGPPRREQPVAAVPGDRSVR
jgi:hypothetical protein